ncbi:MAG: AraC family transcriptional regulator [Steroidobacteraceae bacterium]
MGGSSQRSYRSAVRAITRRALHAREDMSAAPFVHLPALLEEFGVDCDTMLRRAGIGSVRLGSADTRLTVEQVGRLGVVCEEATGCPHFGLLVGQRAGAAAAGLAAEFLGHAETVDRALRMFVAHLHIHDRGAAAALWLMAPRRARLAYVIYHPGTPGAAHIYDASLAILTGIMRRLRGSSWSPTAVLLPRARPASVAPYRAAFRAPLRFDAPIAAIDFPAAELELPLAGASFDGQVRLEALLAESAAVTANSMTDAVLRAITRMVFASRPSADRVAMAFGLTRRRLNDRLAAEGTTYSDLLADVRCEIARQLLTETRLPAGDIAATLHYSSPGAFSRAFKEWTGSTPRELRWKAGRKR